MLGLLRWLLTLPVGPGLAGKKLLVHRPSMKRLGRCRRLLGSHQGRGQLLNLAVFHFKLALQRVNRGLQNSNQIGLLSLLQRRSIGALRMRIRMRSNGAVILQKVLFY